jgi:hypothetical protein
MLKLPFFTSLLFSKKGLTFISKFQFVLFMVIKKLPTLY